jgi:hypothetical protein
MPYSANHRTASLRSPLPGTHTGRSELKVGLHRLSAAGESSNCVLRLKLPPGLPVLEDTLRFVTAYVKQRYVSRVAEQVSLACYELLSNALDYGRIGSDVTLELRVGRSDITVHVQNNAIGERIDMLKKHLDRLTKDPAGTYEAEMTRSLSGQGARAMLGLARVCHEANMRLDYSVDGATISASATCRR